MINDLLCVSLKKEDTQLQKKKLINFGKFWKVVEKKRTQSV